MTRKTMWYDEGKENLVKDLLEPCTHILFVTPYIDVTRFHTKEVSKTLPAGVSKYYDCTVLELLNGSYLKQRAYLEHQDYTGLNVNIAYVLQIGQEDVPRDQLDLISMCILPGGSIKVVSI